MERNSIYLLKIFGIPIRIHASWLIIFVLVTWTVHDQFQIDTNHQWTASTYWIVGIIASLLFFVSVLLHELAHSLVARARGMRVRDIVLFIFGGVSELGDEPATAQTEFFMAFVGPLTSFVLGLIALVVYLLTRGVNQPVSVVAKYLCEINVLLGLFNLVPGFPLDGGRVLRSILWGVTGDLERATRWAARMGSFTAYALIVIGVWMVFQGNWLGGVWFAFIGWFLNNAAQSSYSSMLVRHVLKGHTVREVTDRDYPRVPADLALDALVNQYILPQQRRCLPVVEGERFAGLVTVQGVKSAPRERWPQMRVAEVMVPLEKVKSVHPDGDLWTALEQMSADGVNQLAVVQDGQLVGMLWREAVMGFLRIHAELKG